MWTYLAYILDRYNQITGKAEIAVSELYKFHSKSMILRNHISFWENMNDLNDDIRYLNKLRLIEVVKEPEDTIKLTDLKGLSRIYTIVNKPSSAVLFNKYKERIDDAIKFWFEDGGSNGEKDLLRY